MSNASDARAAMDAVYTERNSCVSLIARMALALGLRAGIGRDRSQPAGWQHVVYVDLPAGQVSWHIPDYEVPFFSFLPDYPGEWDGHSTSAKYERVLHPGLEVAGG